MSLSGMSKSDVMKNIDLDTVSGFGDEWSEYSQDELSEEDLYQQFYRYFSIFNWEVLPDEPRGFDMGCGSGRWAKFVAPRVSELICIDASERALLVAKKNLSDFSNCIFLKASFGEIPLDNNSMDFGYSLGVLHHIPDTYSGLQECVNKIKPGAPFLAYIYYDFENKPVWFRIIWRCSDILRRAISHFPFRFKLLASRLIAFFIYYPLARTSLFLEKLGFNVENVPLAAYRDLPFYSMKTDALDRFGTRLEKRFSRSEIIKMFEKAGLDNITISDEIPYWCAIGYKKPTSNQTN